MHKIPVLRKVNYSFRTSRKVSKWNFPPQIPLVHRIIDSRIHTMDLACHWSNLDLIVVLETYWRRFISVEMIFRINFLKWNLLYIFHLTTVEDLLLLLVRGVGVAIVRVLRLHFSMETADSEPDIGQDTVAIGWWLVAIGWRSQTRLSHNWTIHCTLHHPGIKIRPATALLSNQTFYFYLWKIF